MNRRDLFRIGASGIALASAEAQQHQHIVNAESAKEAAADDWQPVVFDAHQNETVIQLTECIIPETDTPGAKAARVNRYLDLFLRDGDPLRRVQFLEGLSWLDGYAIRSHGAPFVQLDGAMQVGLLERLDRGEAADVKTGHAFFRMVKAMTASVYYATEIGFKELNKGGRVPAGFGCDGTNQA